jgi:rhodanese-related sulfurtransferase
VWSSSRRGESEGEEFTGALKRQEEVDMPTVIDRHGVQQLVQQGAQLLEVLGAREYEAEHIPGAINIPLKNLDRATAEQLDSRRPVITYCYDYQ